MENEAVETDLTGLRYAIYVRKSTEAAEKQVRSLDDQIRDCKKLAEDLGLNIVQTIKETKSAKTPNARPLFKQLLKDIKDREIDAVLAWHPDRLARNTIDSGQIIYLLDTNILKDLRFVSHQFSNDANGKMLLGMLFVFAKHYSDDLSSKVKRGVHGNFREGKSSGTPKHGYIRDEDGIYRPDEKNFKLMQAAWQQRAAGKTLDEIADHLNSNGYSRYRKNLNDYVQSPIRKSILGTIFNDTFYFGMLNQAGQTVDLREVYSFTPMIDEDTFYKVQALNNTKRRGASKKKEVFLPLRRLVYCTVCGIDKPMSVGRSKGRQGEYYLYYRCDNPACERKPRSVRAKVLFNGLYQIVEDRLKNLPQEAYTKYIEEVSSYTDSKKVEVRRQLSAQRAVKKGHEKTRDDLSLSIAKLIDKAAIQKTNQRIAELSQEIDRLETAINKASQQIKKAELPVLSAAEFMDLVQRTDKKLRRGDVFQKDTITRNLFLKLWLDNEKVANYLWKEPFDSLVKATDVSIGRGDRT